MPSADDHLPRRVLNEVTVIRLHAAVLNFNDNPSCRPGRRTDQSQYDKGYIAAAVDIHEETHTGHTDDDAHDFSPRQVLA